MTLLIIIIHSFQLEVTLILCFCVAQFLAVFWRVCVNTLFYYLQAAFFMYSIYGIAENDVSQKISIILFVI